MPTLERAFGAETLTEAIRSFDRNKASDIPLYNLFKQNGRSLVTEGRTVEWKESVAHRHLAPVAGESSPHPLVQKRERQKKVATMAWLKQSKVIPAGRLFRDEGLNSLRPNAPEVVGDELNDLRGLVAASREKLCAMALFGTITIDGTEFPGSDIAATISFSPNTHTATADWDTAATDILDEIARAQTDHVQSGGMPAGMALINDDLYRELVSNSVFREWARYRQNIDSDALQSNIIDPVLFERLRAGGMDWRVFGHGYVPEGGAFTRFFQEEPAGALDRCVLLPPPSMLGDVLGIGEGFGDVVTGPKFGGEGSLAGLGRAPSPGWYAYSEVVSDPVGLKLYAGWIGLPVQMFPEAVTVVDTTP